MNLSDMMSKTVVNWRTWLPVLAWVIIAVVLTQAVLHSLFMDLSMSAYHTLAGIVQAVLILVPSVLYILWRSAARSEQTANEELRRSEQLREDLTAMLVHDLKNPAMSAALALDMLLREDRQSHGLPAAEREMMVSARRNLRRLDDMIGDMMTVSAADTGGLILHREPTDLCAMITEVTEDLRARAAAAGAELKAADECTLLEVEVDATYIQRVLENLIANAIAHTPPGGVIEVSVGQSDHEAVISVSDTGSGIDEELSHELFHRYVKSSPGEKPQRTSVGLGLAYCKIAVEAHGGRIWAENTSDGSRFSFSLPLTTPAREPLPG